MARKQHPSTVFGVTRRDATVRLARLLRLLHAIGLQDAHHPRTAADLAALCDCSRATLFRELRFLQDEQLIASQGQRGGYALCERARIFPLTPLTAEEALALALARSLLVRPGLPMQDTLTAALDKAASGFSPRLQTLFQRAAASMQASPLGRDYSHAPLTVLVQGWEEQITVEMDYTSGSRGRTWRRFDPYLVTVEGSQWMVHGWCPLNNTIRSFALDSLHDARLTGAPFVKREAEWREFTETEGVFLGLRSGPPVSVQVCFAPAVAKYALKPGRWPKGLSAEQQEDGSVLLTGTARGVDGILVELLRWKRYATVEGGPELRKAMRDEIAAMQKNYAAVPVSFWESHNGETLPVVS